MINTIYLIAIIILFTVCKQNTNNEPGIETIHQVTTVADTSTAIKQNVVTDSVEATAKNSYQKPITKKTNINSQIPENGIYTYKIIDVEFGNQQTGTAKVTINGTHIKYVFNNETTYGELIKSKHTDGWVIIMKDETEIGVDFNKKEIYTY